MIRGIYGRPVQETLKNRASRRSVFGPGHEDIFFADVSFVFVELALGATEDREVDVHQQPRIGTFRKPLVLGRQDEIRDPRSEGLRQPGFCRNAPGQLGAIPLVVLGFRVVDRVVEPKRHFDVVRTFRQVPRILEFVEAMGEVTQAVIGTLRLGVQIRQQDSEFLSRF